MEALRKERIAAIQNCSGKDDDEHYYSRMDFTNIGMDGFEDLLLSLLCYHYEEDAGECNDGIVTLHNGLSTKCKHSEYTAVYALQAYALLYDHLQQPEQQEQTKQRIRDLLGDDSLQFDLYFKNPQNMLVKTFIRRKQLNDAVRTTIVCSPEQERQIRDRLETGTNKRLRENGALCVKDDLFSKKEWPVLKLIVPGVSYIYYNEEDEEAHEWTRMVYGIEVHITGPEFMNLKEEMHHDYEVMRIEKATSDFLDLRPFQMGNINLIIAFCKAMSRTGDGEEFLHISKINAMVHERRALLGDQGIDLYHIPEGVIDEDMIERHYRIIFEDVEEDEELQSLLNRFIFSKDS